MQRHLEGVNGLIGAFLLALGVLVVGLVPSLRLQQHRVRRVQLRAMTDIRRGGRFEVGLQRGYRPIQAIQAVQVYVCR